MSNFKGAILATALFAAVVFPFLLMMSIDTFHQHAFLKMTEEVTELVKEEGGVSEHVTQVTKGLKKKDLTVTFSKPGLVKFGEEIVIGYNYEYQNVRGKKTLDGQDIVIIMKRSTGKNGNNSNETNPPTEIVKSYSAKTPESLQPDKEYTFTVPGLKNLLGVSVDMGKVEVVRVEGEKVTVKVSGGKVVKSVQTGGTNTLADEKYVTGEDTAAYNQNGYTGTLERYLYSGKHMPADSKLITTTKTSLFTGIFPGYFDYGSDGYRGILLKNGDPVKTIFSGEYTTSDTKWIEDAIEEEYNKEGYRGTLERYLKSGSYTPAMTLNETIENITGGFPNTIEKDGITLYKNGPPIEKQKYNFNGKYLVLYYGHYIENQETDIITDVKGEHSYQTIRGITKKYVLPVSAIAYANDRHDPELIETLQTGKVNNAIQERILNYVKWMVTDTTTYRLWNNYTNQEDIFTIPLNAVLGSGIFLGDEGFVMDIFLRNTDPQNDPPLYNEFVIDNERYYSQKYTATKPAVDTRVFAYKGIVAKPATDTRIYEYVQDYTGTVTRPEMDTRIYKYRGTVVRPASDTRTYEDYYQYELNFQYK